MSFVYTPVPGNNPANITLPSDGDLASALSVDSPLGDLADKVAHANWPETDNTKSYPLISQTIFRAQPYNVFVNQTDGNGNVITPKWAYELGVWIQSVVTVTNEYIDQVLDVPHNATLSNVYVNISGTTGARTHAGLPTMPTFRVFRMPVTTGVFQTMSNLITDPTAVLATYNAAHQITIPINANAVIDKSSYRYIVRIIGESGANSVASALQYLGCSTEFVTTSMDKGAC